MKGRACQPPSSPESEESWIVACPCGVTHDDGAEMVDCDECGIWVHTVCCHILKGHTSYVCDKCKYENKESEESEVARLLVELPSKTPPLEEKVFTLRTEISREERVHVHGIPGGDPSLFVGVSPVFSRQLWMHTGYVPKAFQYKYNDLPEEKASSCLLFGSYAEKWPESSDLECMKCDYPIEPLNMDVLPLRESNAEKFYVFQDKPSKESKHKHRLQQEDGMKSPYLSNRRRDENLKDFTSKKRSKNHTAEDYRGALRRGFNETTSPLKFSRIASRNSRPFTASISVGDAGSFMRSAYINSSKWDGMGKHGTSHGFYPGKDRAALKTLRLATKAAHKISPMGNNQTEREGQNVGFCPGKDGAASKTFLQKHLATKAAQKISPMGYLHNKLADPEEASQRVGLNVLASAKDQGEEITNKQSSPSSDNEKALQDAGNMSHSGSRKDKDMIDASKGQMRPSSMIIAGHLSPGTTECQLQSDFVGANDANDGERICLTENILTLPGLIEDILNEKGPNVSYDYICEEVFPHWSKLRKHNGERYAYASHRQAVLDCLRNRSAWSHLINRSPKTNLGRKRRRLESEQGEQFSHCQDGGEGNMPGESLKEEVDGSENLPLPDSNKDADPSLPEEVPKGKRKARRGRRLTTQSQQYGARAPHGRRVGGCVQGVEDDVDCMTSPFSEDTASGREDDEIFVRCSANRLLNQHWGSSVDSEDDDAAL